MIDLAFSSAAVDDKLAYFPCFSFVSFRFSLAQVILFESLRDDLDSRILISLGVILIHWLSVHLTRIRKKRLLDVFFLEQSQFSMKRCELI